MKKILLRLVVPVLLLASAHAGSLGNPPTDYLRTKGEVGQYGGRLVVAQRSEPKTLNPVMAVDATSREVIQRLHADLIHINRYTHTTEPALARSWTASPDGRRYLVHLRHGVRFSDGQPFDADDVVFTFQVYLDEKIHSPQRDLLVVGGQPISVQKLDAYTVAFQFSQPYAAGDRLFDSVAVLPRHLLEKSYKDGSLAKAWTTNTPPDQIAGLGPFRLKKYVPGQSITLERNPYYWKANSQGKVLPYLDEVTFLSVPNDDAQVLRFEAGETDIISRLSAESFSALASKQDSRGFRLYDAGPGLEYNFLVFNLNEDVKAKLPEIARRQAWFSDVRFRQAVSLGLDREAAVRLVYQGRGASLAAQVTPGNKLWVNSRLQPPSRSLAKSRELLRAAGFSWRPDGTLVDSRGQAVEFTIAVASSNNPRKQMATLIQQDLKDLGMRVEIVPLEFRSLIDRVLETHNYEAAVLGLGSGDVDPTAEMNVWLSTGSTHVWSPGERSPAPWQVEIDRLMQQQLTSISYPRRKQIYDRVQQIVTEQLPIIAIVSPDILVGAKNALGNFQPAILDHYTLSNVEELFWRKK